jgi:hypothetical protein
MMRGTPCEIKPLQASKWLSLQLLIDAEEIASLFQAMGKVCLFSVGRIYPIGEGEVSVGSFLEVYKNYISALKEGKYPPAAAHPYFSVGLSLDSSHFAEVVLSQNEQMIRAVKPIVQLQPHSMGYLEERSEFKPLVFGSRNISWGLQIAYPQLWQNPTSGVIEKVHLSEALPNGKLFRAIQLWCRENTLPTPFLCKEKVVNVPMRLGRRCFQWIDNHPQLKEKNLFVKGGGECK